MAIFFSFSTSDGFVPARKLLVLQRAASEDTFPNMFEIPGGHAEDIDDTILSTVVRETLEETGLVVKRIVDTFEGFEYQCRKGLTVQLNFLVEVEPGEVQMNPEEHQVFAWLHKGDDLEKYKLTGAMQKVVSDALDLAGLPP